MLRTACLLVEKKGAEEKPLSTTQSTKKESNDFFNRNRGVSQRQVASKLNCSPTTIRNILKSKSFKNDLLKIKPSNGLVSER